MLTVTNQLLIFSIFYNFTIISHTIWITRIIMTKNVTKWANSFKKPFFFFIFYYVCVIFAYKTLILVNFYLFHFIYLL